MQSQHFSLLLAIIWFECSPLSLLNTRKIEACQMATLDSLLSALYRAQCLIMLCTLLNNPIAEV